MSWLTINRDINYEKEKQLLRVFIALSAEFHDSEMIYSVESLKDLFNRGQLEIQKNGHEYIGIVPYLISEQDIRNSLERLAHIGSLKKIQDDKYQTNYHIDDIIVSGPLEIKEPQLTALERVKDQWYRDTYKKEPIIKDSSEVKNATGRI